MKLFIFIAVIFSIAFAIDKDWTLDPKTSTLIPNYMGKVKAVRGKAKVEDRELEKGSKVYPNDLIKTEDKSALVLELIDLTTITLGANSEFKVEKWSFKTKNDREALFSVIKGQWRGLVKSKSKSPDQLLIKTPAFSMGIRGTELLVNVLKGKDKDINQVALLEGEIHLYGSGNLQDQDLQPGDHTIIIKDSKGGVDRQNKILSTEEKKSFEGFSSPDIPTLLTPVAINNNGIEIQDKNSTQQQSEQTPMNNFQNQKSKKENQRFKDTLKELNNAWSRKNH